MKKSRSCLGFILVGVILVLVAGISFFILRGVSKVKVEGSTAPTVIVNSPVPGEAIAVDSFFVANMTATGQNPVLRIELWMDGILLETQVPPEEIGEVTTFYATASILMTEGPHMFFARAVDSNGLIGQSIPISVPSKPKLSANADGAIPTEPVEGSVPSELETSPPPQSLTAPPSNIHSPAPLPPSPPGIIISSVLEYKPIDFGSLLPILLSARPKAPTSLKIGYENCTIRLVWMDNASDETHFNVWMQALGGPAMVIATLESRAQTGEAWYEFAAPVFGIYSFWIEAMNGLGGQSSEIAWVGVTDLICGAPTQLNIEIVDLSVNGGYDSVYCYLSVEGLPEKRIPVTHDQFIPVVGGGGDVSNWTGSGNSILLPNPMDGEITLEGKCLGSQGGSKPDNLGSFQTSAHQDQWDGKPMQITGAGFTFDYRILPSGSENTLGSYGYYDLTLEVPYDLEIEVGKSSSLAEQYLLNKKPTLRWKWDGNPKDISGFTIFLDGKPFMVVGANERGHVVHLPAACGTGTELSVAANYKSNAMSIPAQPPIGIFQLKCGVYVEVKFEKIRFWCLDDGDVPVIPFVPLDCESGSFPMNDTIESYFYIHANGQIIENSANLTTQIDYFFQDLGSNNRDTFLVPIEEPFSRNQPPTLRFGLMMKDGDPWYDADDHICAIGKDISMSYTDWMNYEERFVLECHSRDADGEVTILVKGFGEPPSGP